MVEAHLNGGQTRATPHTEPVKMVDVYYRVRTKADGWLPEVKTPEDYAGFTGAVTDAAIRVSAGSVKYRVHIKGGKWLPCVTGCNINDGTNGYAGNGLEIDAIEVYYYTPDNIRPYKKAKIPGCSVEEALPPGSTTMRPGTDRTATRALSEMPSASCRL